MPSSPNPTSNFFVFSNNDRRALVTFSLSRKVSCGTRDSDDLAIFNMSMTTSRRPRTREFKLAAMLEYSVEYCAHSKVKTDLSCEVITRLMLAYIYIYRLHFSCFFYSRFHNVKVKWGSFLYTSIHGAHCRWKQNQTTKVYSIWAGHFFCFSANWTFQSFEG